MKYTRLTKQLQRLLLLAILCVSGHVVAQENNSVSDKTFCFVYVAPDSYMSKKGLISDMETIYSRSMTEKNPTIFYLVNNNEPHIVKMNLDGTTEDEDEEAFEKRFKYFLNQSTSYYVNSVNDINNIMQLLGQYNFQDEDGQLVYKSVELNFHVGKKFWEDNNNEAVIAPLYFNLNAKKLQSIDAFRFNVFFRCPRNEGSFDRDSPFGPMNLDKINNAVRPITKD